MTRLVLCPPAPAILAIIAENLEEADVAELEALHPGVPLVDVLTECVQHSFWTQVAVVDGVPAAVFGITVGDWEGYTGYPWALFTPKARSVPVILMDTARSFVAEWDDLFECLTNLVHAENTRAIRWLERMGFEFINDVEVNGHPFRQFFMGEPDV